jgi:hypothetical protein
MKKTAAGNVSCGLEANKSREHAKPPICGVSVAFNPEIPALAAIGSAMAHRSGTRATLGFPGARHAATNSRHRRERCMRMTDRKGRSQAEAHERR